MHFREQDLERRFPSVPWKEPIALASLVPASKTTEFGCRYCIAMRGLTAPEITEHPKTAEEFRKHLKTEHDVEIDASSSK